MLGVIPNPTRELTVNFTNTEVQSVLSNLSKYMIGTGLGQYTQYAYDDIIGQLELLKTEFLSLGVSIIISANAISETQSRIFIEVRRAVGSFDQSFEVSEANRHIDKVIKSISALLSNPEAINNITPETLEKESTKNASNSVLYFVVVAVIIVAYLIV